MIIIQLAGRAAKTLLYGPGGNLCSGGEPQLGQDIADVGIHGALAQDQGDGDVVIGLTLRDQSRYLSLAYGQPAVALPSRTEAECGAGVGQAMQQT